MAVHGPIKETIMPGNREYKGKGSKGGNYDEPSGVGTSSAGKTGNQQSSDLASGPGDNAQRGDWSSQQSGNLGQGNQSQSDLGSGPDDNSQQRQRGQSRQSGTPGQNRQGGDLGQNQQSGGQRGSRSGNLNRDDLDPDESL
jgi:hypothetical protein